MNRRVYDDVPAKPTVDRLRLGTWTLHAYVQRSRGVNAYRRVRSC